jgi:radical SAM-linked protein
MAEAAFRLRICYAKTGRLAFLSHLELTRALERLVRRSGLPYLVTQGFSAHMRHAPGPALPVGTQGLAELFDVWLGSYVRPTDALASLQKVAPPGLQVSGVHYADPKAKGLAATHVRESYRLLIGVETGGIAALQQRLAALIAEGELAVTRKGKAKTYDLAVAIAKTPEFFLAPEVPGGAGECHLVTMTLRSTAQGSVRPELLLQAAATGPLVIHAITRLGLAEEED